MDIKEWGKHYNVAIILQQNIMETFDVNQSAAYDIKSFSLNLQLTQENEDEAAFSPIC